MFVQIFVLLNNHNSLDNKGSWRILKDFYCSVTMLRELGLMCYIVVFHVHGVGEVFPRRNVNNEVYFLGENPWSPSSLKIPQISCIYFITNSIAPSRRSHWASHAAHINIMLRWGYAALRTLDQSAWRVPPTKRLRRAVRAQGSPSVHLPGMCDLLRCKDRQRRRQQTVKSEQCLWKTAQVGVDQ